jgi:hypothetical protein
MKRSRKEVSDDMPTKLSTKQKSQLSARKIHALFQADQWLTCLTCNDILDCSSLVCSCKSKDRVPQFKPSSESFGFVCVKRHHKMLLTLDKLNPVQPILRTHKFMTLLDPAQACHVIQTLLAENHPLTTDLMNRIHSYYVAMFSYQTKSIQ